MTSERLETFLAQPRHPELLRWARAEAKIRPAAEMRKILRRLTSPDLTYSAALGLSRLQARLGQAPQDGRKPARVALLGGFTTHPLAELLGLYLAAGGVASEIYEADYGTFQQELLSGDSGFYRFSADFALILPTWRDIAQPPRLSDDRAAIAGRIGEEAGLWQSYWRMIGEAGGQVIQDSFAAPAWRALGNLDANHPAGFTRFIARLNDALREAAPSFVTIHDVDGLAGDFGRWQWADERFFHEAKLPCAPEALPTYAHSLAAQILAQLGLSKKCLALDLDNTLWGGVIGDDGLAGIRIGQGDGESEAFLAFQHYVLRLKQRGVILAVCSKNTEATAREAFARHPGMALKLADISCFMANWDDKAANLGTIARTLNIGLDAIVFVDDNPVERSIIRQLQPEVSVPEMPCDPAAYVRALDRLRYFEAPAISAEDLIRTDFYQADTIRKSAASASGDLDKFLQSLALHATIKPIDDLTLERCVQLINRSNQFNVTTRRHTAADLRAMIADPAWLTCAVSLRDRFGDNGLISIVLARIDGGSLVIDSWLMSCRVLKRGVEHALLNHLASQARLRQLSRIIGEYIPTPRNILVKELFPALGFVALEADGERTRWAYGLDESTAPLGHFIEVS